MDKVWVNAKGDVIQALDLTESQKRRLQLIGELRFPEDAAVIKRLSWESFQIWMYGLNPTNLLARMNEIQPLIDHHKKKGRTDLFFDYMWRWWNGISY